MTKEAYHADEACSVPPERIAYPRPSPHASKLGTKLMRNFQRPKNQWIIVVVVIVVVFVAVVVVPAPSYILCDRFTAETIHQLSFIVSPSPSCLLLSSSSPNCGNAHFKKEHAV